MKKQEVNVYPFEPKKVYKKLDYSFADQVSHHIEYEKNVIKLMKREQRFHERMFNLLSVITAMLLLITILFLTRIV